MMTRDKHWAAAKDFLDAATRDSMIVERIAALTRAVAELEDRLKRISKLTGVSQPVSVPPAGNLSEGTDQRDGLVAIVTRLSRYYTDPEILDWLEAPHGQLDGIPAITLIRSGVYEPVLAILDRLDADGHI